jgi:hypothetical protein
MQTPTCTKGQQQNTLGEKRGVKSYTDENERADPCSPLPTGPCITQLAARLFCLEGASCQLFASSRSRNTVCSRCVIHYSSALTGPSRTGHTQATATALPGGVQHAKSTTTNSPVLLVGPHHAHAHHATPAAIAPVAVGAGAVEAATAARPGVCVACGGEGQGGEGLRKGTVSCVLSGTIGVKDLACTVYCSTA